jgi:hypothetical protein
MLLEAPPVAASSAMVSIGAPAARSDELMVQDPELVETMTMTIEVKCDANLYLYWRIVGTSLWIPLTDIPSIASTIEVVSNTTVTFELILSSGSVDKVFYKDETGHTPQPLPKSHGPTISVTGDSRKQFDFSGSSGGPYSTGYVIVSDD